VLEKLRAAGVAEEDGTAAREHAEAEAVAAALRFAKRRRIGPFAAAAIRDPREREKALGAMVRAGHGFGIARAIIALSPGADIDIEELSESGRLTQT
jgi:regulatory protein